MRRDPLIRLHQLRLAGEVAEIRAGDLRFTESETRELLAASGITLSDAGAAALYQRTEGWAAGLRLAVVSLTGHPDPERFVAEFSGTDRAIGEYLMAEAATRPAKRPARKRRPYPAEVSRMQRALASAAPGWRVRDDLRSEESVGHWQYLDGMGRPPVAYDRVAERRRAVALARDFREAEGLIIAQIAERLGRSPATIKAYFYDPSNANKRPTDIPTR